MIFKYNITIYDSLGKEHTVTFKFMKTASNNFNYSIETSDADITFTSGSTGGSLCV